MPPPILVAGLDARSLLLKVPLLVREGHSVEARPTARALLLDIARTGARLVALGPDIPDLTVAETVRRIRASTLTRGVSVMVLLPPPPRRRRRMRRATRGPTPSCAAPSIPWWSRAGRRSSWP